MVRGAGRSATLRHSHCASAARFPVCTSTSVSVSIPEPPGTRHGCTATPEISVPAQVTNAARSSSQLTRHSLWLNVQTSAQSPIPPPSRQCQEQSSTEVCQSGAGGLWLPVAARCRGTSRISSALEPSSLNIILSLSLKKGTWENNRKWGRWGKMVTDRFFPVFFRFWELTQRARSWPDSFLKRSHRRRVSSGWWPIRNTRMRSASSQLNLPVRVPPAQPIRPVGWHSPIRCRTRAAA